MADQQVRPFEFEYPVSDRDDDYPSHLWVQGERYRLVGLQQGYPEPEYLYWDGGNRRVPFYPDNKHSVFFSMIPDPPSPPPTPKRTALTLGLRRPE